MSRSVVLHSRARPRNGWRPVRAILGAALIASMVAASPALLLSVFAAMRWLYADLFRALDFNIGSSGPMAFAIIGTVALIGAAWVAVEWCRRELSSANGEYSRWLEDEITHLRQLEHTYVAAMAEKEKREAAS